MESPGPRDGILHSLGLAFPSAFLLSPSSPQSVPRLLGSSCPADISLDRASVPNARQLWLHESYLREAVVGSPWICPCTLMMDTVGTLLILPTPAMKHCTPVLVLICLLSSPSRFSHRTHVAFAIPSILLVSFMILGCFMGPVDWHVPVW